MPKSRWWIGRTTISSNRCFIRWPRPVCPRQRSRSRSARFCGTNRTSPRLLPQFSAGLGAKAQQQLERLGVEVRTNAKVESIGDGYLVVANGQRIESANIIWAAGISAHPITRKLGVELDRGGRVRVNPDLSLPGHAEVFAIGDLAAVTDQNGNLVPGVSAAAMQMAQHVARILKPKKMS